MTQLKPPLPCTDPRFQYTPSYATDIRITFARIKAQKQLDAVRQMLELDEWVRVECIDVDEETLTDASIAMPSNI